MTRRKGQTQLGVIVSDELLSMIEGSPGDNMSDKVRGLLLKGLGYKMMMVPLSPEEK